MSLTEAGVRVASLADRLAREDPAKRGKIAVRLVTLKEDLVGAESRMVLGLVFASVFLVLMIACFNVANLLLVRSVERSREMALRVSLGAGRGHLVRLLLGESFMLTLLSGVAGIVLAGWGVQVLRAHAPAEIPGLEQLSLNGTVLGFAIVVSSLITLVFGMLPALQITRTRLSDSLREAGAASESSGHRGRRLRNGLVIAELALSLILLVTAGLMIRSLGQIGQRGAGVEVERRLSFAVNPPPCPISRKGPSRYIFRRTLGATPRSSASQTCRRQCITAPRRARLNRQPSPSHRGSSRTSRWTRAPSRLEHGNS